LHGKNPRIIEIEIEVAGTPESYQATIDGRERLDRGILGSHHPEDTRVVCNRDASLLL